MPVITQVSRHYPQPRGEGSFPPKIKLQQAPEPVSGELLADIEVAVRGVILARGGRPCGLVENRAIVAEKSPPAVTGVRRPQRFKKLRDFRIAHESTSQGRE